MSLDHLCPVCSLQLLSRPICSVCPTKIVYIQYKTSKLSKSHVRGGKGRGGRNGAQSKRIPIGKCNCNIADIWMFMDELSPDWTGFLYCMKYSNRNSTHFTSLAANVQALSWLLLRGRKLIAAEWLMKITIRKGIPNKNLIGHKTTPVQFKPTRYYK